MRKVLGIVLVALAAFSSTGWSADTPAQSTAAVSSCSAVQAAGVKEAQPDLFSLDPQPAVVCQNTCNNIQGHACSTEGQHFFCSVGCRSWACSCMGGSIECGLP